MATNGVPLTLVSHKGSTLPSPLRGEGYEGLANAVSLANVG